MQIFGFNEVKFAEMDSLESLKCLAEAIYPDIDTEIPPEQVNKRLYDTFVCGIEAVAENIPVAWAYATAESGIYYLHGYNNGVNIFVASQMGQSICDILFNNYNIETILSVHKIRRRNATALIKRIGFKKLLQAEDKTIFYRCKSWEAH